MATTVKISAFYRYPVKGLSAEPLQSVRIEAGQMIPGDRAFVLARGNGAFSADHPTAYLPKTEYLMLARDEILASVSTSYDDTSGRMTISRGGKVLINCNVHEKDGISVFEDFFSDLLELPEDQRPHLATADRHSFSDVPMKCVSMINMASLRDLEQSIGGADAVGKLLDPLRFRANIYFEGAEPWAERDWAGKRIQVSRKEDQQEKGPLLYGLIQTERCAATNVNPATGERDANLPKALMKAYNHNQMGIYTIALTGGELRLGDQVEIS